MFLAHMLPKQTVLLFGSKLNKTLTDPIFVLPFLIDAGSSCSHRAHQATLCSLADLLRTVSCCCLSEAPGVLEKYRQLGMAQRC